MQFLWLNVELVVLVIKQGTCYISAPCHAWSISARTTSSNIKDVLVMWYWPLCSSGLSQGYILLEFYSFELNA